MQYPPPPRSYDGLQIPVTEIKYTFHILYIPIPGIFLNHGMISCIIYFNRSIQQSDFDIFVIFRGVDIELCTIHFYLNIFDMNQKRTVRIFLYIK